MTPDRSDDTFDRRTFLKSVAASGAAFAALGCASGVAAGAAQPTTTARSSSAIPSGLADRIGVQLYSVRDRLEKDFTGTLEGVAKIGFKEVEFAGYYNRSPEEVRSLLDRLGLRAPSSHIMLDALQKDLGAQVKSAKTIGHEYLTVPALMQPFMGKVAPEFWATTAKEFNRVAKALKDEGVGFAYHNHSFEFEKLPDGKTGYDVLLAETDPALVKFELDLRHASPPWAPVRSTSVASSPPEAPRGCSTSSSRTTPRRRRRPRSRTSRRATRTSGRCWPSNRQEFQRAAPSRSGVSCPCENVHRCDAIPVPAVGS